MVSHRVRPELLGDSISAIKKMQQQNGTADEI